MGDGKEGVRLVKINDGSHVVLVNPRYIVKVDIKPSREPGNDFYEVHLQGFQRPLVIRKGEFEPLLRSGAVIVDG